MASSSGVVLVETARVAGRSRTTSESMLNPFVDYRLKVPYKLQSFSIGKGLLS
jgi:hypothetical protein